MATVSTTAPSSSLLDVLKSATVSYVQSVKSEIVLSDEARFEANRDWCENYKCPAIDMVGDNLLATILAYLLKGLDMVIQVALEVVYNLLNAILSAFVAVAGPVAVAVDSILILTCYLYNYMVKGNLLVTCCTDFTLIEAIIELLKKIWGVVKPIVRKALEIWFNLVEIYEQMMYKCDCDRLAEEQYADELKSIKELYGNQYSEFKIVTGEVPKNAEIGTQVSANSQTYTKNNDGVLYVLVKMKSPAVGKVFKEHVRQTINAYNRYPFGADEYCWATTAEYLVASVSWKIYAEVLISFFLSSVNLNSLSNPNGVDHAKYRARLEYCKRTMPEPLYEYIIRHCTSAVERDEILESMGL